VTHDPYQRSQGDSPSVGVAHGRNESPQTPGSIDNPGPMTPTPDPGPPTPNPEPPTPNPPSGQPHSVPLCAQGWPGLSVGYCGALNEGLVAAQQVLIQSGCREFYGGNGARVLSATRYRFLDLYNRDTGAATQGINSVFINSNGPYMTYNPAPGRAGPFGRFWTQPTFRAFILLHELGHQLSPITGFRPDANDRALNEAQSGLVLSHCF
jgi:hypothetical protein